MTLKETAKVLLTEVNKRNLKISDYELAYLLRAMVKEHLSAQTVLDNRDKIKDPWRNIGKESFLYE